MLTVASFLRLFWDLAEDLLQMETSAAAMRKQE
jgi:hypothetical protein